MKKPPITTILFDLDGTLLNVDMYQFVPSYLTGLARSIDEKMDSEHFVEVMIERTMERLRSDDGSRTNEQFFLEIAWSDLNINAAQFNAGLTTFYRDYLYELQPLIIKLPLARQLMQRCMELGFEVVIATNPVFPRPVVDARLNWGGLGDFDYRLITSFENSCYCKPNPNYFKAILSEIDRSPESCLMVGNDTEHDMSASAVGITTFLVDAWVIDRGWNFVPDYRGSHLDLYRFIGQL